MPSKRMSAPTAAVAASSSCARTPIRACRLDLACSNTLPGTASRRNMERHGFSVAYPKLLMLRE